MENLVSKMIREYLDLMKLGSFGGRGGYMTGEEGSYFVFYGSGYMEYNEFINFYKEINNLPAELDPREELKIMEIEKRLRYKTKISGDFFDQDFDYADCYCPRPGFYEYFNSNLYNDKKRYESNCQEEEEREQLSKEDAQLLEKFENWLIKKKKYKCLVELLVNFKNVNVEKVAEVLIKNWKPEVYYDKWYLAMIPTLAKKRFCKCLKASKSKPFEVPDARDLFGRLPD